MVYHICRIPPRMILRVVLCDFIWLQKDQKICFEAMSLLNNLLASNLHLFECLYSSSTEDESATIESLVSSFGLDHSCDLYHVRESLYTKDVIEALSWILFGKSNPSRKSKSEKARSDKHYLETVIPNSQAVMFRIEFIFSFFMEILVSEQDNGSTLESVIQHSSDLERLLFVLLHPIQTNNLEIMPPSFVNRIAIWIYTLHSRFRENFNYQNALEQCLISNLPNIRSAINNKENSICLLFYYCLYRLEDGGLFSKVLSAAPKPPKTHDSKSTEVSRSAQLWLQLFSKKKRPDLGLLSNTDFFQKHDLLLDTIKLSSSQDMDSPMKS